MLLGVAPKEEHSNASDVKATQKKACHQPLCNDRAAPAVETVMRKDDN